MKCLCENCTYYVPAENIEVMPGPFTGFCICPKKKIDFAYIKAVCNDHEERKE